MNWYKFDSIEAFDVWHLQVMKLLGLPKASVDSNGTIENQGVITDSYTKSFQVSENDFRALVEPEYSEGLVPSESPFPPRQN
jgi:hypothetical protein